MKKARLKTFVKDPVPTNINHCNCHEALGELDSHWPVKTHLALFSGQGTLLESFIFFFAS